MKRVSYDIAVWANEIGYTDPDNKCDFYITKDVYLDTYSYYGYEMTTGELVSKDNIHKLISEDCIVPAPTVSDFLEFLKHKYPNDIPEEYENPEEIIYQLKNKL